MYSAPHPTTEKQIQMDIRLSRQFHEDEKAILTERISQLADKRSAEHFEQKDLAQYLSRLYRQVTLN